MKKILIAGTVAFDEVTTPFGYSGKILGGSATYLSLAASLFDNRLAILSVVGKDFPENYLSLFAERGIDTTALKTSETHPTFYWKGLYYEDVNRRDTLLTLADILEDFRPEVPEAFKEADFVVLGNLDPQVQWDILEQLSSRPELTVLDTMNFWMEHKPDMLKKVIERIDLLLLNEEEARMLSGKYTLIDAARKILETGPRYVIIKRGEHGSTLFSRDGIFTAPAYITPQVKDPTGAGDTFAGGLAGYLSEESDTGWEALKNAVVCGTNLASFTIEDFGINRLHRVTRPELKNRVENYVRMTDFSLKKSISS